MCVSRSWGDGAWGAPELPTLPAAPEMAKGDTDPLSLMGTVRGPCRCDQLSGTAPQIQGEGQWELLGAQQRQSWLTVDLL